MQLGDAVAVGVLDQHHRGVGHVDAHLYHRRGHQHIRLTVGERSHRGLLLRRPQLPMEQDHPEVRQLTRAQPLELRRGRTRRQQLRFLD